jgi:hemoglobin
MKKDIIDIADIKVFVDEFYDKVRNDNLIGPVFLEVLPGDWQPHLDKMYSFWNAALFGQSGYKGNPFSKHAPLNIGQPHFDRWLVLFEETIDKNFEGTMAEDVKRRAQAISVVFVQRLNQIKGNPNRVVV